MRSELHVVIERYRVELAPQKEREGHARQRPPPPAVGDSQVEREDVKDAHYVSAGASGLDEPLGTLDKEGIVGASEVDRLRHEGCGAGWI